MLRDLPSLLLPPHSFIPPWSWFCQSVKARCQTLRKARAESPHPLCKNSNCNPTHRFPLCPSPLPQSASPLSSRLFPLPLPHLTCRSCCSAASPLNQLPALSLASLQSILQDSLLLFTPFMLELFQTHTRARTCTVCVLVAMQVIVSPSLRTFLISVIFTLFCFYLCSPFF